MDVFSANIHVSSSLPDNVTLINVITHSCLAWEMVLYGAGNRAKMLHLFQIQGAERLKRQHFQRVRTSFIISAAHVSFIFMNTWLILIFATWSFMKPFKPLLSGRTPSLAAIDVWTCTCSQEVRSCAWRAGGAVVVMNPGQGCHGCLATHHYAAINTQKHMFILALGAKSVV